MRGNMQCPTKERVFSAIKAANMISSSTELTMDEQKIKDLNKQIAILKQDVDIAKDRATMVARPEATASYYDGWFPLNKPLKHVSVPILIGFATLFLTLALMLLLELVGIKIIMQAYVPQNFMTGTPDYRRPFYIMGFFALLFFIIMMYLFLR